MPAQVRLADVVKSRAKQIAESEDAVHHAVIDRPPERHPPLELSQPNRTAEKLLEIDRAQATSPAKPEQWLIVRSGPAAIRPQREPGLREIAPTVRRCRTDNAVPARHPDVIESRSRERVAVLGRRIDQFSLHRALVRRERAQTTTAANRPQIGRYRPPVVVCPELIAQAVIDLGEPLIVDQEA